jgi:hypothetical protein
VDDELVCARKEGVTDLISPKARTLTSCEYLRNDGQGIDLPKEASAVEALQGHGYDSDNTVLNSHGPGFERFLLRVT